MAGAYPVSNALLELAVKSYDPFVTDVSISSLVLVMCCAPNLMKCAPRAQLIVADAWYSLAIACAGTRLNAQLAFVNVGIVTCGRRSSVTG